MAYKILRGCMYLILYLLFIIGLSWLLFRFDDAVNLITGNYPAIVFHIYPTSYLEKGSGRTGQNLIVGYIISKTCLGKKSNSLAYACGLFFDTIIKYGCFNMPTLNIQTQFLIKINLGSYNEFINNQLKRTRTQMLLIIKDNRCIDDVRKNIRLQMVYELVKKRSFIPSQYWIRVNSKGILCTKSVSRIV